MLTLRRLSEAELREVFLRDMRRDFPRSELKPMRTILQMCREGVYDALGAYDAEGMAAYAMVYRNPNGRAPLLDYLAVEPGRRGGGIGGAWLSLLRAHYAQAFDALLIECEAPDRAPDARLARARLRFYEREGAQRTDLRATLFGVDYLILSLPLREERIDCACELSAIYERMFTPEGCAKWARLYREA